MSAPASSNRAESLYFAQPYSICAEGFYFSDLEDYRAKAASLKDEYGMPVEEFEIQYIDGDDADLFSAVGVTQASLDDWFELLVYLEGNEDGKIIACHLASEGYTMEELFSCRDDYSLYHGTAADYAEELVSECYTLPGNLAFYIDYERMGRDMMLESSIAEIKHDLLLIGG
jgi:hypothetical protein